MGLWELDSGFKDDFTGRVDTAEFKINERMGDSMTLELVLTDYEDQELVTLVYTCGPGWETADGGNVVHFKGKERFTKTTKLGLLMARIIELVGVDGAEAMGDPKEAKTWVNIVMHIVSEDREYTFQGTSGTTRDSLPTEFWDNEKAYLASQGASVSVTGSKKAEEVRKKLAASKTPTPLLAKLDGYAKTATSHDEFMEKALAHDEVAEDDDLVTQVTDPSPTGFYATHH